MLLLQITAVAKTEKDRVEAFLRPVLNPKVPKEIAPLLEVARGAMILGWYFYPLATRARSQGGAFQTDARLRHITNELYGTEIHVVRAEGKIFIVAAEGNVTEAAHHD